MVVNASMFRRQFRRTTKSLANCRQLQQSVMTVMNSVKCFNSLMLWLSWHVIRLVMTWIRTGKSMRVLTAYFPVPNYALLVARLPLLDQVSADYRQQCRWLPGTDLTWKWLLLALGFPCLLYLFLGWLFYHLYILGFTVKTETSTENGIFRFT